MTSRQTPVRRRPPEPASDAPAGPTGTPWCDDARVTISDFLDTNACSWSDGPVTNTCSILEDHAPARTFERSTRRPLARRPATFPPDAADRRSGNRTCRLADPADLTALTDLAPPAWSPIEVRGRVSKIGTRTGAPRVGRTSHPLQAGRGSSALQLDPQDEVVPVPTRRPLSNRPSLQVRRRRALATLAVLVMLFMLALPWGGTGGPSLATPGAAPAGPLVAGSTYVVHQGDTLWGIAERLAGGSDPRPLVVRLEAETGGDDVHPGQQLVLP